MLLYKVTKNVKILSCKLFYALVFAEQQPVAGVNFERTERVSLLYCLYHWTSRTFLEVFRHFSIFFSQKFLVLSRTSQSCSDYCPSSVDKDQRELIPAENVRPQRVAQKKFFLQ